MSGNLLTNIFAGGTVDTEWGFLTGYSQHQDFTKATDSYVWYFDRQGYQTRGGHPGFGWFYDRENVNQYLASRSTGSPRTTTASWWTRWTPSGTPTTSSPRRL